MDWYVAVIIGVIIAVIAFFVGWTVGVDAYKREHLIDRGDDVNTDNQKETDDKQENTNDELLAISMLLDGWCDDCENDVSICMKNGHCMWNKNQNEGGKDSEH